MPQIGGISGHYEIASGFLSAFLMVGGTFVWATPTNFYWFILAPFMMILGLITLLTDVFPFGRQPNLSSEIAGFIAGCISAALVLFSGYMSWFLTIATMIALLKILKKAGKL